MRGKPRHRKGVYPDLPFFALAGSGAPVWSPRDYTAFAREGYAQNPIAFRAVRMIAEAAASVPF